MSSDGSSMVPTPRQYRPTYARLSSSASTSSFEPFPRSMVQPATNTKRRQTNSIFPPIDHLRSAPTVAASGFTASVSNKDISHPTPKPHRLSLHPRTRTPTRIPTPIPQKHIFSSARSVSSPAAPQKLKENALPTTHRLLGPILPGPPPPSTLTKSRTMNVLSSITSTFSRSTNNLNSSRSSINNLCSLPDHATNSCLPVPAYTAASTANIRQITLAMPATYWLGRYQALHDRFRNSNFLDPDSLSSPNRRHRRSHWTRSTPTDDDGDDDGDSNESAQSPRKTITTTTTTSAATDSRSDDQDGIDQAACSRAEENLSKRVFAHLDALCVTPEARRSLKAFQQAYARRFACEALLPLGGTMVDEKREGMQSGGGSGGSGGVNGGFIARAGRLFSGGVRKSVIGGGGGGGLGISVGSGSGIGVGTGAEIGAESGGFGGAMMQPRKSAVFGGGGGGIVGGRTGVRT